MVTEGTKVCWQGRNKMIIAELHMIAGKWQAVLPDGKHISASVVKTSKTFKIL